MEYSNKELVEKVVNSTDKKENDYYDDWDDFDKTDSLQDSLREVTDSLQDSFQEEKLAETNSSQEVSNRIVEDNSNIMSKNDNYDKILEQIFSIFSDIAFKASKGRINKDKLKENLNKDELLKSDLNMTLVKYIAALPPKIRIPILLGKNMAISIEPGSLVPSVPSGSKNNNFANEVTKEANSKK